MSGGHDGRGQCSLNPKSRDAYGVFFLPLLDIVAEYQEEGCFFGLDQSHEVLKSMRR
jgi:hypothetical protein